MVGDHSERERLVAALKASRAGTWRWDVAADRVDWDEALSAVYGLPHERAPKTSAEFLQLIHPDDRERAGRLLGALLESGREIEYEFRAVVGDRIVWIYDRSTLVRDAGGRPSYMTGACLDVTERKKIEEERNVANEKYRLLLRELHHRVTNHLQMITTMLRLQTARLDDLSARGSASIRWPSCTAASIATRVSTASRWPAISATSARACAARCCRRTSPCNAS